MSYTVTSNKHRRNFFFFKQSVIQALFKLCTVNIVFDVHYELTEATGDGVFVLIYDDVQFQLTVNHTQGKTTGKVVQFGTNTGGHGLWDLQVKAHPYTPHIQLIGRQVCHAKNFVQILMRTFFKVFESLIEFFKINFNHQNVFRFSQLRHKVDFQKSITNTFKQWSKTLEPPLKQAINEIKYPEIDFENMK